MNVDSRLFVGGETKEPLPPLYKGRKKLFYPGQLIRNTPRGRAGAESGNSPTITKKLNKSALRRYVFRYENGKFVYLATRKGQRNGGFNSKPSQTSFSFNYAGPGAVGTVQFKLSATPTEDIYVASANSIIKYDNAETRWEWTTRPALTSDFYLQAFSSSTSNSLRTSTALNEVSWTYINDPYVTATPQVPITVNIDSLQWFNNNSLENLNKWPIKNIDADYNPFNPSQRMHWQKATGPSGDINNIIPDRRIEGLTDDFLFRCFEGVNLKPYDIVFVEVVWRMRMNRADIKEDSGSGTFQPPANYLNSAWGYQERIHDYDWWSPSPFKGYSQKGRVYRIGKLEADTGVRGYDKVTWAQRTRVVTTKWQRGGKTVLE